MHRESIKILFNTPSPKLHGGPPTHLPLLEAELRKRTVLETFYYGRRTDSETVMTKLFSRSKDLLALRSQLYSFQPDIIHHNTAFDNMAIIRDAALLWLAKQHGVPVFLKMHGSCDDFFALNAEIRAPLRQLRNSILNHAACIGVLSEAEKSDYLRKWPFLGDRVNVVKNIVKPVFHRVARMESRHPSLLFASRFTREKGMFELLKAVPQVIKKFPAAQFTFLGSGPDAPQFDRAVRESNLSRFVTRIEHVENVEMAKFYEFAWILIFPTHHREEGMPMVVAEASAAGVPIITTRTKFSRSYMTAKQHCLFLEDTTPESIHCNIVYLLERKEVRDRMSRNNRKLAKFFECEVVTNEFLDIYNQVLDSQFGKRDQGPARSLSCR